MKLEAILEMDLPLNLWKRFFKGDPDFVKEVQEKMLNEFFSELHKKSFKNREYIEKNRVKHLGCFYCLGEILVEEVEEWADQQKTPLCPRCGIDSLLPEGFYDKDILVIFSDHYFGHLKTN